MIWWSATAPSSTGSAARRKADVAIDGGRITHVGEVAGKGAEEIDAAGRIVTPASLISTPTSTRRRRVTRSSHPRPGMASRRSLSAIAESASRRSPEARGWLIDVMENVEEIPAHVLRAGLAWDWKAFPTISTRSTRVTTPSTSRPTFRTSRCAPI